MIPTELAPPAFAPALTTQRPGLCRVVSALLGLLLFGLLSQYAHANNPAFTSTPNNPTTTQEDSPTQLYIELTAPEQLPPTLSLKTAPTGMTLTHTLQRPNSCLWTNTGGNLLRWCRWYAYLQWTPNNDDAKKNYDATTQTGNHTVELEAKDNSNNSSTFKYTHRVKNRNNPPTLTSIASHTTPEDSPYTQTISAADVDPTNDTLTFRLMTSPPSMRIDNATGALSWNPNNNDVGQHPITIRVEDGRGASATTSYILTVTNVNDSPSITSTPPTGAVKEQLYRYAVLAVDQDPTRDTLLYNLRSFSPASAALTPQQPKLDSTTGIFTWTPARSDLGKTFTLSLEVSDGNGGKTTQRWDILVTASNQKPTFTSTPPSSATEDLPYTYTITAVDRDGDPLSFSLLSAPQGMNISSLSKTSALLKWTPTNAQVGLHPIKLQVEDGKGGVWTQEFSIAVTNVNDPPIITSLACTVTDEGKQYIYAVKARDVDPTKDRLTFSLTTAPPGMVIDPTLGLVQWTPDNSNAGKKYTFTVKVDDGHSGSSTQSVQLEVLNINNPPTITSTASATATQGALYKYIITATDPDPTSDTLYYRLIFGPNNMSIGSTGLLQWTPENADAITKTHAIILEVSDGKGGATTQTFTLTVGNVNDPPLITSTPITGAIAFQSYQYNVKATDLDPTNDTITYTLLSGPTGMLLNPSTGLLQWAPKSTDKGKHSVSVEAKDNKGAASKQNFELTVVDQNNPPTLTSTPGITATEDQTYSHTLKATDKDNDPLLYILEQAPPQATLNKTTGLLTWLPGNNDVGSHVFTYRVDDGKGGIARGTFTLTVKNVNDAPQIISQPVTVANEKTLYTYQVKATDVDPTKDILTFSLSKSPPGMTLNGKTGDITWTPDNNAVGRHLITIEVSDGNGGTHTQSYTLTVKNVNDAPVFSSTPTTKTQEDTLYSYRAQATDPDPTNNTLTFKLLSGPKGLTLDSTTGLLLWMPNNDAVGPHKIELRVEDGNGGSATQTFTLTVENINDPPSITSTPPTGATKGKEYLYQIKASDPDPTNDTLTFKATQKPGTLTLHPSTGALSWKPTLSDAGLKHPVTIVVEDGKGGRDTQSWQIEVFTNNTPPVFTETPTKQTALQNKPYQYQLKASDPNQDTLTYRLLNAPKGMSLHTENGLIQWTPTNDDVGNHIVAVQIDDGKGGTQSLTFGLTVDNINDPPKIISTPPDKATEDTLYTYQVLSEDIDPPGAGDVISYSLENPPKGMSINKNSGLIQWTPTNDDALRVHLVKVKVDDAKGGTDTQTFNIKVLNINDHPKITSQEVTEATEKKPYLYLVKAIDIDPTKDKLTFSLHVDPKTSTLNIDASSGLISWTPDNDASIEGKYNITIKVEDGNGGADTQKFILKVLNINDPPSIISSPPNEATMGQTYTYNVKAVDPDPTNDKLVYSLTKAPQGMNIDKDNGLIQWTPDHLNVGEHDVELKVEDRKGGEDSQSFKLRVLVDAAAPIANILPLPLLAPNQLQLDGSASRDPNNKTLTFDWTLTSGPDPNTNIIDPASPKPKVILRKAGLYRFRLIVANPEGKKSKPAFSDVTIQNVPPFAHAGWNFTAKVNTKIQLDGTQSDDSNGDRDKLQFSWKQSAGEPVQLDNADTNKPSFTPGKVGIYKFELTVSDSQNNNTAEVLVVVIDPTKKQQHPPHAVFRAVTQGTVGQVLQLDASRSRSLSETELKYAWQIVEGPKKDALGPDDKVKTTFTPTQPGSYLLQLVVRDAISESPPAFHRIDIQNPDQTLPSALVKSKHATFETWTTLDGSKSTSTDNSPLSFQWKQLAGPPIVLKDNDTPTPSFFALNKGSYKFQLIVKQKELSSPPQIAFIHINDDGNQPPTAHAGDDLGPGKAATAGKESNLDGSKSTDPEAKPLSFQWRQLSGIPVVIESDRTETPTFIPIAYGVLTFQLSVSDGSTHSLLNPIVTVLVNDNTNHIPTANAGPDQQILAGVQVQLDGSQSTDEDKNDTLTFQWRQLSPSETKAQISLNTKDPAKPTFNLPKDTKINAFVFGLLVDDGKSTSFEDTVSIKIIGVNQPPKAVIAKLNPTQVNTTITLDGSQSSDPNTGDKLSFTWKQVNGPKIEVKDPDKDKATFTPTEPGSYAFELTVSDGTLKDKVTAEITVTENTEKPPAGGCTCTSTSTPPPWPPLGWMLLVVFFGYRAAHGKKTNTSRNTTHPQ